MVKLHYTHYKLMLFVFITYYATGFLIILDSLYTIFYTKNQNIYKNNLDNLKFTNTNNTIDAISSNYQNCESKIINYLIIGCILMLSSLIGFVLRKPINYKWKYELTLMFLFESLSNIVVFSMGFLWWFKNDHVKNEMEYIYITPHDIIHDAAFYMIFICIPTKIYLFWISFNDYLSYIK